MTATVLPRFSYQWEKMAQASRALMAPFQDVNEAFANSFDRCWYAFRDLDISTVDDTNALNWIATIKSVIDTTDTVAPDTRGTYYHKAKSMDFDDKSKYRNAVVELTSYFTYIYFRESARYDC